MNTQPTSRASMRGTRPQLIGSRSLRFVQVLACLLAGTGSLRAQASRIDFLFTIPEPSGVTEFGRTVALLGDINGDTFPDIAVAANSSGGGVVLFYSGSDGSPLGKFRSPQPDPDRPESDFDPAGAGGLFARSMCAIPDANGDGIMDVAIGASRHKVPGAGPLDGFAGVVYLVDPTDKSVIRTLVSPNPSSFGQFGFSIDGFWTFSNKSLKGLIVGAPGEHGVPNPPFSNSYAGRAYAYNVETGSLLFTAVNPTESEGLSAANLGNFGLAVAVTSNTDSDFFISEPGANFSTDTFVNTGRIYGYQGISSVPAVTPRTHSSVINPLQVVTDSRFGESLAALQFAGPNYTSTSGITYIGGHPRNFPSVPESNTGRVQLAGSRQLFSPNPQTNGQFGASVAAMLDATGNGRSEVVIGEPLRGSLASEPFTDNAGFVHIYSTDNLLVATLPREGEPMLRARFGASVSGTRMLHQISNQSRRRLLVGAQGRAVVPKVPSAVYVYKVRTRLTGDLNNDFQVNATDLNTMQNVVNGSVNLASLSPEILDVIDVNNDGSIDNLDLLALRRILGLDTNAGVVGTLLTAAAGPFPGQSDPAVIGFAANPDSDDLANVFELWRGTNPARADMATALRLGARGLPSGGNGSIPDHGSIEFEVDPSVDDLIRVRVHFSFDLKVWRDVTASRTRIGQQAGRRTLRFDDSLPLPSDRRFFVRFSADPDEALSP